MAYVPPHRRKKDSPPTADLTTAVAPCASFVGTTTTTTTRPRIPWQAEKTTADHHARQPATQRHHHHRCQEADDNANIRNALNDDVELLCTVLTRMCCINLQKRPDKWQRILQQAQQIHARFANKMERFEAVQGCGNVNNDTDDIRMDSDDQDKNRILVKREWNATKNAQYCSRVTTTAESCIKIMTAGEVGCALSHVRLWQQLLNLPEGQNHSSNSNGDGANYGCSEPDTSETCMLILEDDVVFTCKRGKSRFARAFGQAWKLLPSDWSILYLGFSSRGERLYVQEDNTKNETSRSSITRRKDPLDPEILLYRPTYGFHTHAYVINQSGAAKLLENLPVIGPIDVWLADNAWFGLTGVYCAVIANEGWRSEDGTYEGSNLVSQDRRTHPSDIRQSAHAP